jgi:hypothetical protein
MNTRRISITALIFCQLVWTSAAYAGVVSQSVPIDGAEQIEVNVPIALHVEQGEHESLTLSTDQRDMKELRVRQDGARLSIDRIERDHLYFSSDSKIHATLIVKKLSSLHLNGAGTVTVAALKAERLELVIAGAGSMDLKDLRAASVEVSIAGAGEIDASGAVDTVNIHVSGLGAAALEGLASRSSHVTISGGGSVKLAASDDLDATISGIGQVRYVGSPHVFKAISGIGSVEPLPG